MTPHNGSGKRKVIKEPVTVYCLDPADRENWYTGKRGAIIQRVRMAHMDLIGMRGNFKIKDTWAEAVGRTPPEHAKFLRALAGKPDGALVTLYEAVP